MQNIISKHKRTQRRTVENMLHCMCVLKNLQARLYVREMCVFKCVCVCARVCLCVNVLVHD